MPWKRSRPRGWAAEETLDPDDWTELQTLSHRIVDDRRLSPRCPRSSGLAGDARRRCGASSTAPLPRSPTPLADVYREVAENVMPYPMGNIHPRFWSWYMGSSNFTGALGDFLAAVQGSNLGGGNHAAALMDQQVVNWCKEMIGFPASASGTLVSGGSMANIIGLTVARNVKAGIDVREHGVAAIERPLRFYGSDQIHSCHRKAMEALGLGNRALRRIPTDAGAAHRSRGAARGDRRGSRGGFPAGLRHRQRRHRQHRRDRRSCRRWPTLAARGRPLVPRRRLHRRADRDRAAKTPIASPASKAPIPIALDPHKWLHAPFEAGCALVRDASAHRNTFAVTPEYLESTPRGLASAPLAARLRSADHARFSGAQDLDGAQGTRHREVRPADRPEHRAGRSISAR